MKIESCDIEILKIPVEYAHQAARRMVDANLYVLARIRMTDGIKGIGYIVQPRGDLMRIIAAEAGELSEGLPGMDVRYTEAIWAVLAGRANWVGSGGLLH